MTSPAKIVSALALAVLLLAPAGLARAGNPGPASAAPAVAPPPSADAPEAVREAYWRGRARAARERVAAAREHLASAEADYARMRNRNVLSGEPRAEIIQARTAAQQELEAALQDLQALPEQARRAGALPGWLRE